MPTPASTETEPCVTSSKELEQEQLTTVDPASSHAHQTLVSSEVSAPTRTDSEPQQASTQPGDGGKSHVPSSPVDEGQPSASKEGKIPWKDQVLGYAKLTRGKMLGKQTTIDVGHKILQGEILPEETRRSSN